MINDEISIVSNSRLMHIHQKFFIFLVPHHADVCWALSYYQVCSLSSATCYAGPVFIKFKNDLLTVNHSWEYFKICELKEVVRQRGDKVMIDL